MEKLSVSIITLNEEKNIRRCLESVAGIADEIVVVDSFSKDQTEAICSEFGVRFSTHKFDGHIEQKNRAMNLCQFEHILSLDADEALSDKLKQSILHEKEKGFPAKAYRMNRLTNYCGSWIRHSGWYPDRKIRLIHRDYGYWGGANPHDQLIPKPGVKVEQLQGDLFHYSYYTTEDHFKQVEYFTTIGADSYYKQGKKAPLAKLYLAPIGKFVRDYFFNRGFLDGKAGWQVCTISAKATFLKYKKLRKLHRQKAYE